MIGHKWIVKHGCGMWVKDPFFKGKLARQIKRRGPRKIPRRKQLKRDQQSAEFVALTKKLALIQQKICETKKRKRKIDRRLNTLVAAKVTVKKQRAKLLVKIWAKKSAA